LGSVFSSPLTDVFGVLSSTIAEHANAWMESQTAQDHRKIFRGTKAGTLYRITDPLV